MQQTQVRFLGWKDPLEKEMATHSGILAQKIPWTEEPGGLQSMGSQRAGHNWVTNMHTHAWQNLLQSLPEKVTCSVDRLPWGFVGGETGLNSWYNKEKWRFYSQGIGYGGRERVGEWKIAKRNLREGSG